METYLVIARFAHFLSTALVFGLSLFGLYGMSAGRRLLAGHNIRAWLIAGASISFFSGLLWWDAMAVTMSRNWLGAADPRTLMLVLFSTQFGHVWVWRLLLAAVLLVLLIFWRTVLTGVAGNVALATGAGLLAASIADTGHAVMLASVTGGLLIAAQAVHIIAVGAWLGGLIPLGLVLWDSRRVTNRARFKDLADVLGRFSTMGLLAVAAIIGTGGLSALLILPNAYALTATLYGEVLLVKISVFVLMAALAADNRWRLSLRLTKSPSDVVPHAIVADLTRNVMLENACGFAVLFLVSLLGTLSPLAA
jgi:copper resistance protein D